MNFTKLEIWVLWEHMYRKGTGCGLGDEGRLPGRVFNVSKGE